MEKREFYQHFQQIKKKKFYPYHTYVFHSLVVHIYWVIWSSIILGKHWKLSLEVTTKIVVTAEQYLITFLGLQRYALSTGRVKIRRLLLTPTLTYEFDLNLLFKGSHIFTVFFLFYLPAVCVLRLLSQVVQVICAFAFHSLKMILCRIENWVQEPRPMHQLGIIYSSKQSRYYFMWSHLIMILFPNKNIRSSVILVI